MATLEEMQQRISGSPVVEHGVSVVSRYTDAYLMARTIASFGAVVKGIAVVVGIVVALIGLVAGGSKGFLGGVMVGAIFGLAVYVMGIFVAAQGQILKATLDTAVNTSRLLTEDQMREAMSLK